MEALKQLRAGKQTTILKADKANCTVVMNRKDYEKNLLEMLTGAKTYKRIIKE